MTELCSKYCEILQKHGAVQPSCRSYVLKASLIAQFGERLSFHRPARRDMSEFVLSLNAHRGALIERCAKADAQLQEAEDENLTVMDVIDPGHDGHGFASANHALADVFHAAAFLRREVFNVQREQPQSVTLDFKKIF